MLSRGWMSSLGVLSRRFAGVSTRVRGSLVTSWRIRGGAPLKDGLMCEKPLWAQRVCDVPLRS